MVRVCQIRIKPLHPNERIIVFLPKPKLTPYFHGWDHSIFRASLRLNPKPTLDLGCLYNHYLDFIWSVSWYTEPIQFPIVQGLVPVAGAGGWPCYRCSTLLPSPASLGSLPCPLTLSVAWSSQTSETGDSRLLPISVILQRFSKTYVLLYCFQLSIASTLILIYEISLSSCVYNEDFLTALIRNQKYW